MTLDDDRFHGDDELWPAHERLWSILTGGRRERVGGWPKEALGWATVELDRAQRELIDAYRRNGPPRIRRGPDDELLGARVRILAFKPIPTVVLLEPMTEGRIAASLARYGEGYVAAYVIIKDDLAPAVERVRGAGLNLSREAPGPFGRERLVGDSPPWGAHLILAANDRQAGRGQQPATIAP